MIKSLKDIIEKCVDAYLTCQDDDAALTKWILDWPGQVQIKHQLICQLLTFN